MAISYSTTAINNQLDEITALIDAGAGAGLLRIYNGSRPADPDTAVSGQTLLAELTLTDPAAPAAASGVLTFSTISDDASANASGTASWFRVVDSDGNAVIDGDVGENPPNTADLIVDSVDFVAGGTVSVTSWVITGGNA